MPQNITTAEQGREMDIQNQYNTLSNLSKQFSSGDPNLLRINRRMNTFAGLGAVPSATPSPTITSASLTPETPMTLKQPEPLTGAAGLLGEMEAGATNFQTQQAETQKQNAELTKLKAEKDTSKNSYLDQLGLSKGQTALEDQAYSATVDPIEKELNTINQQILQEQHGLRRQIEALDKQNMTDAGRANARNELERQSATKQADLTIIQMGVQGRYDSAKAIADRKIAVALEKDKQTLETLKFVYEENRDAFTKAEQRQFETAQADRERELNRKEATMKQFEDTRLALLKSANEQGAPVEVRSAIANSKTIEEAFNAIGEYGKDPRLEYELENMRLDNILRREQIETERKERGLLGEPTASERKEMAVAAQKAQETVPILGEKINLINSLLQSKGMAGAVGAYGITRWTPFSADKAARQEFAAGVNQLVNKETIDTLVNLKERGGTLGALSDQERVLLQSAATKIGTWMQKDENNMPTGKFEVSEATFRKELETIRTLAEKAQAKALGNVLDKEEKSALDEFFNTPSAYTTPSTLSPASYY